MLFYNLGKQNNKQYLIRFLPNFAVFFMFLWIAQDFADLPEFCGSTTARNIRSPDLCKFGELFWQQSCHLARRKGRGCPRQKCGLHTGLFLGPFSLLNGVSAAKNFPRTHTSEPACRLPLVFYICVIIIDHYSSINIKNLLIVITLRGFSVVYFQWIQYWVVIRGVWMLFYSERATTNRDNVRISCYIILYTN